MRVASAGKLQSPNEAASRASQGDAFLVVILLAIVHLVLLVAFAKRWRPVGLVARAVGSGIAGAGGYLLLLGAISVFRSAYADPFNSTWEFGGLLAIPTILTTVVTGEVVRARSGSAGVRAGT
ncbi:MAG: hypothetical protein ABIZ70_07355 [Gemmatimonadales bacterium]